MPSNRVLLVAGPPVATSYIKSSGRTRTPGGKVPSYGELATVIELAHKNPGAWRVSPGMYSALVRLDEAMKQAGSKGLRVTEASRSLSFQASERVKYDAWIAAGKPQPGSAGFNSKTMRTAFICKPGESGHNWGGSIDIDVAALDFPGMASADQQLAKFWELAKAHGFSPVIPSPDAGRSECWHFDHLGPMASVRKLFEESGGVAYGNLYGEVNRTACALFGLVGGDREFIQARLLLAGIWVGRVDGQIGPKTLAGLARFGIEGAGRTPEQILADMDLRMVAYDQMAAL